MNEQLILLIQLQEIDGRIRALGEQKDRIPGQLAEIEQRVQANKTGLDQAREALEAAQKAKRDRDRDLEEGGRKVEKLKGRTSEIKTNKEYTALLKEIETAEQENKAIEDDILKLMEQIDAAAAEIQAAQKRAAEEGTAVEAERKQLEESAAAVERGLAEAERAPQRTAPAGRRGGCGPVPAARRAERRQGRGRDPERVLLGLLHEHPAPALREREEERADPLLPPLPPDPLL